MTQAKVKFATFEKYLSYSNKMDMEGRYELVGGELAELPPESELNIAIVIKLRTCQRHSRAGGNPPPHLSSRWIPACAGMTGKRPIDHGYRYNWIANYLQFLLAAAKVSPLRLIRIHSLELQVPVLQPNDAANRYPDLVLLRPEHLDLMKRRLTITLDMPPPRLIAEVVSPGTTNRDRDYIYKRAQYAAVSVPEY